MRDVPCGTCNEGTMKRKKVYRLSGCLALAGYIILLPSLFGVFVGGWACVGTGSAVVETTSKLESEVRAELRAVGVRSDVVERVVRMENVADEDVVDLSPEQRRAIRSAEARMTGGMAGAGLGSLLAGGISGAIVFGSLLGAVVGWLLTLKKRILQCNRCKAVVAAS